MPSPRHMRDARFPFPDHRLADGWPMRGPSRIPRRGPTRAEVACIATLIAATSICVITAVVLLMWIAARCWR